MMNKFICKFEENNADVGLLGMKGANLSEMTGLGLPVPVGLTVTSEAFRQYAKNGAEINDELAEEILKGVSTLDLGNKTLADGQPIWLTSVRPSAGQDMPGMMDTILNLGLNNNNVEDFGKISGSLRFAYECYQRLIESYGHTVLAIPVYQFNDLKKGLLDELGVHSVSALDEEGLKKLVNTYLKLVRTLTGSEFEQDPKKQLLAAVASVFESWNNERAQIYRELHGIPDHLGMAVVIQKMVFGNKSEHSGSGIAVTRNPTTGDSKLFGEFLRGAQGVDLLTGNKVPESIYSLTMSSPQLFGQLSEIAKRLEEYYGSVQNIAFTIDQGELFILQTSDAELSAVAFFKVASDMVNAGILSKEDAIRRAKLSHVRNILHPELSAEVLKKAVNIATGLPASAGAVCGKAYFTSKAALEAKSRGESAILVKNEMTPRDINAMVEVDGVLTATGGMTSHAAVVTRGMGKSCITGCVALAIDTSNSGARLGDTTIVEGDYITIDGSSGKVYQGRLNIKSTNLTNSFMEFMSWTDELDGMQVFANCDTPEAVQQAISFGAKGIGLCRSEHMFFKGDRMITLREVILADTDDRREAALEKMFPLQKEDFADMLNAVNGNPLKVRLLDLPLHEVLPKGRDEILEVAQDLQVTYESVEDAVAELAEVNPMMGLRGCRIGVLYPNIYATQTKALVEAALENYQATGVKPNIELIIPLISTVEEMKELMLLVSKVQTAVDKVGVLDKVKIGAMLEVPRACLIVDQLADICDSFSFGTNDLTQMTYGYSRDDARKFLTKYKDKGLLAGDPFKVLDREGVGSLIRTAIEKSKIKGKDISYGVCGEQTTDVASIQFLQSIDVDYISCSLFKVLETRLAASKCKLLQAKSMKIRTRVDSF